MNPNYKPILFLLIWIFGSWAFNAFAADIFVVDESGVAGEESENDEITDGHTQEDNDNYDENSTSEQSDTSEQNDTDEPSDGAPEGGGVQGSEQTSSEAIAPGVIIPEETEETDETDETDEINPHEEPGLTNYDNSGVIQQISASGIAMGSAIIDDENIVVYDFDELKSALSGSNRYVGIYLGADINMKALGIEINSAKKKVLISGMNPLNGSGPFTINEYNSLDPGYTIRVVSNSGTKEVLMKDINVTGRNYYGAICVYDGVSDVKVTFENVNYNGPQISYNRGGTVCVTGNSDIRIIGGNGLSEAQELVEARGLELGGNTVINHYAPIVSGVWLVGSGSYIKVLSGADVTWNETGSYMIYQDNTSPAELTLENGARLTINTISGLFYDSSTQFHQFGNVLLDTGSALEIMQQGTSSTPIIKVKNGIQVLEDANLMVFAQSAPLLLYMTGAADFIAESPDTLALYNKTNKLVEWSDSGFHNISILSKFINYWINPCDLAVLGRFDDFPSRRWRKKGGADLSVEISASSTSTKSVASNYADGDYGEPPNEATLNIHAAKIITAGRMRLELDDITDTSLYISGQTEPRAELLASYTDTEGTTRTAYGKADSGGAFDIELESPPARHSMVTVYSSAGYKNVFDSAEVIESPVDTLAFIHVPHALVFPRTSITAKKELIAREDENWRIIIEDTRGQGSAWGLYVRLKEPLTGRLNGSEHRINDAVVFINNDGDVITLTETAERAASGAKGLDTETIVEWASDKGIMLFANTLEVYSGISYTAKIEWILADVP